MSVFSFEATEGCQCRFAGVVAADIAPRQRHCTEPAKVVRAARQKPTRAPSCLHLRPAAADRFTPSQSV